VKFTGLGAGTYTLTETVTPKGFNTCDPIVFEILFNEETKTFSSSNNEIDLDVVNGVFTTTVINEAGSKLPTTGGMGTTLFYVFGGIMVLAAVVLLVTKKRMAS
jgi:LPXTG-motif cell wall-anchored protein